MAFFAKKSLGQNFLRSQGALFAIIKAGEVSTDDIVLEIGPGEGALTKKILETGATVIAIEKDDRLIPLLSEKFQGEIEKKKFHLIHKDVLETSVAEIFSSLKMKQRHYKLIANIPYYITGEIMRKYFEEANQPERMVLLVQKEVAERIVARDSKESILSVSVKAYGKPRYVKTVGRECFSPQPNVDSAILEVSSISKEKFDESGVSEKEFFAVVKKAFAHKRKKLSGNLKEYFKHSGEDVKSYADKRAEDLSVNDFFFLSKSFSKGKKSV